MARRAPLHPQGYPLYIARRGNYRQLVFFSTPILTLLVRHSGPTQIMIHGCILMSATVCRGSGPRLPFASLQLGPVVRLIFMPYNGGEPPTTGQANPRYAASLAVPFFQVTDIEASLRFYVEGLGSMLTNQWSPEGRVRWCWLELDRVALMLQEYWRDGRPGGAPEGPLSQGLSICVFCENAIAIYRDLKSRGLAASRPVVGNGLWVTSAADPDGCRIDFESPTKDPEETVFKE